MDTQPVPPAPQDIPTKEMHTVRTKRIPPLIMVGLAFGIGLLGIGAALLWYRGQVATGAPMQEDAPEVTPTITAPSVLRMSPMPDWRTYTDATTGMTLRYPPSLSFGRSLGASDSAMLTVLVEALADIPEDLPLGMGRNSALSDKATLEAGEAKNPGDFTASNDVVRVGDRYNGRVSLVLSRFEVCSVLFIRSLVFYPGDYRVTVTLSGDNEAVTRSMPSFFMVDPANCGGKTVWNRELRESFLTTLADGKGAGAGQTWYDSFDGIVESIVFSEPTRQDTAPTSAATCQSSDPSFCAFRTSIQTALERKDYASLIRLQTPTSVTCMSEGMFMAICDGQPDGAVKEGYALGYYQSEGVIQEHDKHLQSLAAYLSDRGPFQPSPVRQSGGDKGTIVYLNADNTYLLIFRLRKTTGKWSIQSIIVGATGLGTVHQTLPVSIFQEE